MKNYSVVCMQTGDILRVGQCSPAQYSVQAQDGEGLLPFITDPLRQQVNLDTWKLEERAIVDQPASYLELRAHAYPSIRDQLDAFWKGGDAAEAMRVQVLAVKARFPKTDLGTSS
jgi:hypothetical protein